MRAKKIEHIPTEFPQGDIAHIPTIFASKKAEELQRRDSRIQKKKEKSETEQQEEYYDALQLQATVISSLVDRLCEYSSEPSEKELRRIISSALQESADGLVPNLAQYISSFEAEIMNALKKHSQTAEDSEVDILWEGVEDEDPIMVAVQNTGKAVSILLEGIKTSGVDFPDSYDENEKAEYRRTLLLECLAGVPTDEAEYERYMETSPVMKAKQSADQALSAAHHFVSLGSSALLKRIRQDTIENIAHDLPPGAVAEANKPMLLRAMEYRKSLMALPSDMAQWSLGDEEEASYEEWYEPNKKESYIEKIDAEAASRMSEGEEDEDRPFFPMYRNVQSGGAEISVRSVYASVKAIDRTQTERAIDPLYEVLRNTTLLVERLRELASMNAADDNVSVQVIDQTSAELFHVADRIEHETLKSLSMARQLLVIEDAVGPEKAALLETLRYMMPPSEQKSLVYFAHDRLGIPSDRKGVSMDVPHFIEAEPEEDDTDVEIGEEEVIDEKKQDKI